MKTKKLFELDSREYEHPVDRTALTYLSKLPGFDKATNFFINWGYVKWHLIDLRGSNFRVTEQSCPELYKQVRDIADILDVRDFPEIYTQWGYFINAYTTGYKADTLLTIYSGAVDLLSKEQLDYIIGHELGHIKSKHVLYHVMADMLANWASQFPIASDLIMPLRIGLAYWNRMSEFTADRAGLLACQNPDAAIETVIKMAGVPQKYFASVSREAFLEQAKEFEYLLTGAESVIKNISVLDNTHPWTVLRAAELIKWIESGEYERVLNRFAANNCPYCHSEIPQGRTECPVCGRSI